MPLPMALASVGTAGELALEDQLAMFQLMADLDQSISNFSEGEDFSSLMLRQREIILDLEDLLGGIDEEGLNLRNHQLICYSRNRWNLWRFWYLSLWI